jgi:hypothetical protein
MRGGDAAGNENSRIGQRLPGRFSRIPGKLSVQNYVCHTRESVSRRIKSNGPEYTITYNADNRDVKCFAVKCKCPMSRI